MEPVLCPISPDFVEMLRQPGGLEYTGRFRIRLQDDGVLVFEAVHDCFIMQCDTAHIDGSASNPRTSASSEQFDGSDG